MEVTVSRALGTCSPQKKRLGKLYTCSTQAAQIRAAVNIRSVRSKAVPDCGSWTQEGSRRTFPPSPIQKCLFKSNFEQRKTGANCPPARLLLPRSQIFEGPMSHD
jgi:hypothetical protein